MVFFNARVFRESARSLGDAVRNDPKRDLVLVTAVGFVRPGGRGEDFDPPDGFEPQPGEYGGGEGGQGRAGIDESPDGHGGRYRPAELAEGPATGRPYPDHDIHHRPGLEDRAGGHWHGWRFREK